MSFERRHEKEVDGKVFPFVWALPAMNIRL